jgi:hypothetical protein
VIDLGTRRELFVDRFLIERLTSARLTLHEPRREDVAIAFDSPWEGIFSGYPTVLHDGERYRAYYRGLREAGRDGSAAEVTCTAESPDGIHWTKPSLGLFEVAGTRQNNVILAGAPPFTHNFSPLLDTRPDVPEGERFKALAGLSASGLVAFVSGDGVRWRKWQEAPVFTEGVFDSQNVAFWSEHEGRYLCYFRSWKRIDGANYRWISRTESPDFLHWSAPVEMTFGDAPAEHLYTNGTSPYFRAPHLYLALAKRFFEGRVALPPEEAERLVAHPGYRAASSDSVLMTSRGGDRYDRTFLEAFIRPGPSPRDWICRDNTPALGVVPGGERALFLYRGSHYAQPTCHLARYSLRTDGFISVQAPYAGGELLTKPFTFAGSALEINVATSAAGGVRVELQEPDGRPIPGYALADCPEILGDDIARTVLWTHGADLKPLAGRPVRLRFAMKDADLYSLRCCA